MTYAQQVIYYTFKIRQIHMQSNTNSYGCRPVILLSGSELILDFPFQGLHNQARHSKHLCLTVSPKIYIYWRWTPKLPLYFRLEKTTKKLSSGYWFQSNCFTRNQPCSQYEIYSNRKLLSCWMHTKQLIRVRFIGVRDFKQTVRKRKTPNPHSSIPVFQRILSL